MAALGGRKKGEGHQVGVKREKVIRWEERRRKSSGGRKEGEDHQVGGKREKVIRWEERGRRS